MRAKEKFEKLAAATKGSTMSAFPDGFLWGAATAGHQIEGDNANSDTWFAELVPDSAFREPSGRACNSWELWREDVDLVAAMGLNAYRFSVEWARIQPEPDRFDAAALEHYEAIVDYCHERSIEPIVTLNHFTNPLWFAELGAWLNPSSAQLFAAYCRTVIERFGDRLRFVVTLNEPNLPQLLTWMDLPAFIRDGERRTIESCQTESASPAFRLANVVLPEEMDAMGDGLEAAHLAARAAIHSVNPHIQVGLSIAIMDDRAEPGQTAVRDRKREEVYGRWLRLAQGDDFVGVQNYETISYDNDGRVALPEGASRNGMGTALDPSSLAGAIEYAWQQSGRPVLVTEHGLAHDDDELRAEFIPAALAELRALVARGVPVLGYCHWSLLDNFEWLFGYAMHYGLHAVDRSTFVRTPKASAHAYAAAVASFSDIN